MFLAIARRLARPRTEADAPATPLVAAPERTDPVRYAVSGRARFTRLRDGFIHFGDVVYDRLPGTNNVASTLTLRPPPDCVEIKPFGAMKPPVSEVRRLALTERSLFDLDFMPTRGPEYGYSSALITTAAFETIRAGIDDPLGEYDLTFAIGSRGERHGEWGFGDIATLLGDGKRVARVVIFGPVRLTLRHLVSFADQNPPPPSQSGRWLGQVPASLEVKLPDGLRWAEADGTADRSVVRGDTFEIREVPGPPGGALNRVHLRYTSAALKLTFFAERIHQDGRGLGWAVSGFEHPARKERLLTHGEAMAMLQAARDINHGLPYLGATVENARCQYVVGLYPES